MKFKQSALLGTAALWYAAIFSGSISAQEIDLSDPEAIADYANFTNPLELNAEESLSNSMGQVTNVNQLRDVAPTDWAYEALRSLVDRYGCIVGYPNQTYRGSQPLTRYEFAAGLNSCLNQIERLIAANSGASGADLETIERLSQEFAAELASLGGRVDEVESRTALLEDNAFSFTTKLVGEATFQLAEAYGDDVDTELVFTDKIRLQLVSSFTGQDKLFTRLTAGNIDNSFQDEIGTREGRFAHDGPAGNNVVIDRLHYSFPVGEKLNVTAMAVLGAHHFYAETFNTGLNTGGGGTGALTRFGERNPIYRQGIGRSTAGVGAKYTFNDFVEISAGYIAPSAANPTEENGLFNGSFSALGQVTVKPIESLKVGVTYVRSYDNDAAIADDGSFRPAFLFGGTGTNAGNLRDVGVAGVPVATDTFGAQFEFDITEKFSIRGWGSYTDANIINAGGDNDGSATIWNYAAAVVFSDLVKEGSLAALIVGAEPYLTAINANGDDDDEVVVNDVPIHLEALYKYPLNDNISITPGFIWLLAPNQNQDNEDVYIGTVRTTFTF
ncbi:carbohydrate porin [Pleurocapsales cyanobacterium LEGE 10410]|nr:carbohydrate porin [Pleurocapsales cyanobacterium LEGE 10410]